MIDPIQTLKEYDRFRYSKDAAGHEHDPANGQFTGSGLEHVDPGSLNPNPRQGGELDDDNVDSLRAAIRSGKKLRPIVAIRENREIVDGNHRAEAAKKEGVYIPVFWISKDEYRDMKEDYSDDEFSDVMWARSKIG